MRVQRRHTDVHAPVGQIRGQSFKGRRYPMSACLRLHLRYGMLCWPPIWFVVRSPGDCNGTDAVCRVSFISYERIVVGR